MAAYTTQAMTGVSLVDDILTCDAPPAGALGWAIPDGKGGFIDIGLGDLTDSTPGALTAQAILAKINVAASAAAGVQVSIVNNLLVFGLNGTAPGGTIQIGGTIGTPGILILSTTAY